MEMKDYEALKRKLCKELEEVKDSKSFGMAEIEIIDKLIHSIKNIGKIEEMEAGGSSYARDMMSDSYRRSYGDNSYGRYSYNNHDGNYESNDSYAGRRGTHYVRGHYSYADEASMLKEKIQKMIDDSELSLDDKSALTRAMDVLRK